MYEGVTEKKRLPNKTKIYLINLSNNRLVYEEKQL